MEIFTCRQCGAVCDEQTESCAACGALLPREAEALAPPDPKTLRVRELLDQSRRQQHVGDLTTAIRCAREALLLRPDCSTIHATLGALYEQVGDEVAARYHFQTALSVTPVHDCPVPPVVPEFAAVRASSGSWRTLVLIGCILFSGVAVLFTLWPIERDIERGTIIHSPSPAATNWIDHVPEPAPVKQTEPDETTANDTGTGKTPVPASADPKPNPASATPATVTPASMTTVVLGPSASSSVPAVANAPTLEQAEQAEFTGNYERAVATYEALLRQQDKPNPNLHHKLALNYQRLGNTPKAAEHLNSAVQDFRKQVADNPQDTVAQQELRNCEAALKMLNTHDQTAP